MSEWNVREWIEIILALSIIVVPCALLWHRTKAKNKDGAHFGIGVRTVQFVGGRCCLSPFLF
jgi:hypothetical protein